MKVTSILTAVTLLACVALSAAAARPAPPSSLRLYVFDCGTLEGGNLARFQLKPEEVPTSDMSVACYLIAHPKGTLMWDVGAVPDTDVNPAAGPTRHRVALPNGQDRFVTLAHTLKSQLAATGYAPADITYLALSHYHYDHTANANEFAASTWLVRPVEREAMFSPGTPTDLTQPSSYSALRTSKTILIKTDDYDVFGDGTVVLKLAPGHTPGHQVLFLKLPKTGPVVLAGDLYHYQAERALHRIPTFDSNAQQTAASRAAIDAFLKKTGAQLWIQHDFAANAKLKKAPSFYD